LSGGIKNADRDDQRSAQGPAARNVHALWWVCYPNFIPFPFCVNGLFIRNPLEPEALHLEFDMPDSQRDAKMDTIPDNGKSMPWKEASNPARIASRL
jgi:hypothetical protein